MSSPNSPSPILLSVSFIDALYSAENWSVLIHQLLAVSAFSALLFCAHFKPDALANSVGTISASMQLFVISNLIGLLTSLPTSIHKVFTLFDANTQLNWIFWFYAINGLYQRSVGAFFVLCLTVERILLLCFPVTFMGYRQKYVLGAAMSSVFFTALDVYFYSMELPLDPVVALASYPTISITPKYKLYKQNAIKIIFCTANLFASIWFLIKLRQRDAQKKINNRSVKFTVIVEFIFDTIPSVCDYLVTWITGKATSQFIGPLPLVLINFGLTLCSLFYARIYLWKNKSASAQTTLAPAAKNGRNNMTTVHPNNPSNILVIGRDLSAVKNNNWTG